MGKWHKVYTDVDEKANAGSTEGMYILSTELTVLQSISSEAINPKWGC